MGEEKQFHRRSGILLGLFVLCLALFAAILYDAQVVNAQDYLSQSTTQVTTTQKVEAYRGILTDRNGKVLVSNRQIYAINFNPDAVTADEDAKVDYTVSRALLRLIKLCREQGVTWTDTLPISTEAPYTYTFSSASSVQCARLQKFLTKKGWSETELTPESGEPLMTAELRSKQKTSSSTLSAQTLLELLAKEFNVDPDFTAGETRLVVGVLYELRLRKLNINNNPYVFAEDVSVELISMLSDGNFEGVEITSESVRQYHTDYAAHVLGQVGYPSDDRLAVLNQPYLDAKAEAEENGTEFDASQYFFYRSSDIVGEFGAEQAFESYLRGRDGTRVITTNEEGKITSELYSIEPQPGGTVALTIDIDLQEAVENALAATVEAMNAEDGNESRGAAAVVVSVADSDVLALASYPNYSPKNYRQDYSELSQDPGIPFLNRATNGTYAPGSTFKLCTAVAALETGVITPTTKIQDKGVYTYWQDYQPKCWIYRQSGGTHGKINVSEAIYHSCNYFFYEVGRLTGIDTLNEYAAAFGLGQSTGIELGEKTGVLDGPDYRAEAGSLWVGGSVLACAIGNGDSLFTPLQMANYVATLVRGGDRYSAHILENVTSYDGSETLYTYETQVLDTVEMSASTLAAVKKGMGKLTTEGSLAKYFADCVVTAGAKTGSAQTNEAVANGVFVCFAPFDEPEIAVAIVIEQGGSGSALASTAVEILNAYFAPSDIGAALVPEGSLLP